jgi:alpha-N-arabinofuranosidase
VGEDSRIPNTNGIRNDVAAALRNIKIPVLRWPGGAFADEYHWKDGIGPKDKRVRTVNSTWGDVVDDNSFGTHEFFELCSQLDCEPYVCVNVGNGTVREMTEWIEYMTYEGNSSIANLRAENGAKKPWRLKYLGIGNENWIYMHPENYAELYYRFQAFAKNHGDNELYKIACGSYDDLYNWTETIMKVAGECTDAISIHYYTMPGKPSKGEYRGGATGFTIEKYYETMNKALWLDEIMENHLRIMSQYDPKHRVGLVVDEWGTWFDVEPGTNPRFLYQQNAMRDAMVAAATLNIFNKHSDRVVMANLAQTVNVLQSVILTEGADMILTPTYHVFDLFKVHQDAVLVDSFAETEEIGSDGYKVPNLSVSSSIDAEGTLNITIANLSAEKAYPIDCTIVGMRAGAASAKILTERADAYNDFKDANRVAIKDFTDIKLTDSGFSFEMPPISIILFSVK